MRIRLLLCGVLVLSCSLPAAPQQVKVATYNIFFLDAGISAARKANLQRVIQELDADIIGFQEINDRKALENILPESYAVALLDDPAELQEVAVAVRAPFEIDTFKTVFPGPDLDFAFPRKRDVLEARVSGRGREFVVFVHHAKSRRGGRGETDPRREKAAALLVEHIRAKHAGDTVILLGDFNDNPDDKSVNILEFGTPAAAGGIDSTADTFLFNATEALLAKDYCSHGYNYLFRDGQAAHFDPVVAGSRAENNKWRGKPHDYRRDVKIKAILFDQILVSLRLRRALLDRGIVNIRAAAAGQPSRIRFVDGKLVYTRRGEFASDHVPVWAVFQLNTN